MLYCVLDRYHRDTCIPATYTISMYQYILIEGRGLNPYNIVVTIRLKQDKR